VSLARLQDEVLIEKKIQELFYTLAENESLTFHLKNSIKRIGPTLTGEVQVFTEYYTMELQVLSLSLSLSLFHLID
jgi:hypothetical protein